ncbi:MAG TPA: hypothetical protein ENG98_04290 [Actinobacteria bacterium]|nr:hypothetical protein [Actinomycetota bacterium]
MSMTESDYTGYIVEANVARTHEQYELAVWVQMTQNELDELRNEVGYLPNPSPSNSPTWPSYIEVVDEVTQRWALKERLKEPVA